MRSERRGLFTGSSATAVEDEPTPTADRAAVDDEGRSRLLELARRKARGTAEILVEQALAITRGADEPVRVAALEALLRRATARAEDQLVIAARPASGRLLGVYATRRRGDDARPYATALWSLDPLHASCGCRDFLRGSLGLCKHALAIVEDLARKPARLRAARAERLPARERPALRWDPVRPLLGRGDWLDQVEATGDEPIARGRLDSPEGRIAHVERLLAVARGRRQRDPAISELLEAERERLEAVVADRDLGGKVLERSLARLTRRPYPYQVEGVRAFLATGRLLLADDMGLGKTLQAIAAAHVLFDTGRARRALVLAPASLKSQWLREWTATTDIPAVVVDGGPAERAEIWRAKRPGVLIANYELLLRDLDLAREFDPELVVLDEAQRIKNWATKTAACVAALSPRYRLVLTGTPFENRLDELASVLEWVDDRALAPRWRLSSWHSVPSPDGRGAAGARNLDVLRERLSGCMIRRVRKEVLTQLPPRTDTVVPVELTPAQAEEHDAQNPGIARILNRARHRPLTRAEFLLLMNLLTKQRLAANGLAQLKFEETWPTIEGRRATGALLGTLSMPKLEEVRELLARIAVEQGRKVVVFSQWRRTLLLADWATRDQLARAGVRSVFFTGEESRKERDAAIVALHDDPSVRVLFATDAGGVGLNLQRAATCCVNLDVPWNPAVLEQRIGRIYRLGQERPIDTYCLVTEGSIEARIAALVRDKRALFSGLFDGTSDEVLFERSTSFLARVERIFEDSSARAPADGEAQVEPDADARIEADAEASPEREAPAAGNAEAAAGSRAASSTPRAAGPVVAATAAAGEPVAALFAAIRVDRRADGGITIDAPPESAGALASLLEGFAGLLRAGVAARPGERS